METEELTEQEEVVNQEEETVEQEEEVETPPSTNAQATALWDLLNNQATAKSTLNTIAKNLGLTVVESKTTEGRKAIKDVIAEALGGDLAFLGEKLNPLGDAIEAMINGEVAKLEQKMQTREEQRLAAQFSSEITIEMAQMDRDTKGEFSALMPKINKLTEEIPIGNQTVKQYLKRVFSLAKSESADVKASPDKVQRARKESEKTSLLGSGEQPNRVKEGSSRLPTIREAVAAAARGVKLEN